MKLLNRMQVLHIRIKANSCGKNIHFGDKVKFTFPENLSIGDNVRIGDYSKIQTWPQYGEYANNIKPVLQIGNDVSIMPNCQISCANKITIGDGVLFGDNVFISDNYHGSIDGDEIEIPPVKRRLWFGDPIIIEDNVWIGRNVCIMPGVSIGRGAIIGANAVVTHDVPKYSVAVGTPARVVKKLKN